MKEKTIDTARKDFIAYLASENLVGLIGFDTGVKAAQSLKSTQKFIEIIKIEYNGDVYELMDWYNYPCYSSPHYECMGGQISLSYALSLPCIIHIKCLLTGSIIIASINSPIAVRKNKEV